MVGLTEHHTMEIVYKFTIQTSMALGNGKSQLLLEMEKQVWQLLFSMVEGGDLDTLLQQLVKGGIPWDLLAAVPEGDRKWFDLSTTSAQVATSSSHHISSSSSPPPAIVNVTHPIPSSCAQALMTQDRADSDMDLGPDFEHARHTPPTPPSPLSDLQEPMDTHPDCQGHTPVNADHLPQTQPDYPDESNISLVGRINQDLDEDIVVDDVVSAVVSLPDSPVRPPRTWARLGEKINESYTPTNAQKNRRPHSGTKRKNQKPSSQLLGEKALKNLLAAGESYGKPIDVESVDVLMRNFPIMEEHQVRFDGFNLLMQ